MSPAIKPPQGSESWGGASAAAQHLAQTPAPTHDAELLPGSPERAQKVGAGIDFILDRDAELLERLADA